MTRSNRLLPAVLLTVALVAVAASGWFVADRSHPRTHVVERHVPAPSRGDLSAIDCPLGQTCQSGEVSHNGRDSVVVAAQRYFLGSRVVDHWAVRDDSDRLVAEYLTLLTEQQTIVEVVSRCISGSVAVPGTAMAAGASIGPAVASVVVAGRTGCGVAVIVDALLGQPVPRAAAVALAHDPNLPLP